MKKIVSILLISIAMMDGNSKSIKDTKSTQVNWMFKQSQSNTLTIKSKLIGKYDKIAEFGVYKDD